MFLVREHYRPQLVTGLPAKALKIAVRIVSNICSGAGAQQQTCNRSAAVVTA
jgi:hypothetical protein